jgi:hypothetical protein
MEGLSDFLNMIGRVILGILGISLLISTVYFSEKNKELVEIIKKQDVEISILKEICK